MRYLLDTNVISEIVSKQPNQSVLDWVKDTDENLLHLSVITIGEIKKGIEKLPSSARKDQLVNWLQDDLLQRFRDRLVSIDIEVMLHWGELTAHLEMIGRPLPAIDSLIAASVSQGDFVLVTRNTSDFMATGIPTLNPWEHNS
jgi:predicted nucleic acid-binding protein